MKISLYGLIALTILVAPEPARGQGGLITTVAGGSRAGFSGDGGPATSALLGPPDGVAVDGAGNLFIADTTNHRVRQVNTSGIITTVAGSGMNGYSGDGGPATSARLNLPHRVAVDGSGNIYIAVSGGHIRKVNTAGTISTVAGGPLGFSGDGGPATSAGLSQGTLGVAVDNAGNVYIADSAYNRIRKVNPAGIINTIAGNGTAGYSGDGGPATSAMINGPGSVAVDNAGNLYIADSRNQRIRKVNPAGIITTVAGSGTAGFSGDGGPATNANLSGPFGVAVDGAGNLYIPDSGNRRIRKVDTSGIITTVAGGGRTTTDGGAATEASIGAALDVAVDTPGNLYFPDGDRIRKVTPGSAGSSSGPPPIITDVLDAAAYTKNIAQGSAFVVKGTNLCGSGTVFGSLPYSSAPLNNVKITFSPVPAGKGPAVDTGIDAYMVYTFGSGTRTQLSGILPSTVAPGDYNVAVTNNGSVSGFFKTTVVAHKFGIITVNGSGAGRAVVQNYISPAQYDLGRYTTGSTGGFTYSPAHPGQVIVIWGTGLGPISSPDNAAPGLIDLRGQLNVQVLIDGVAISPDLYAGRAPTLPGADEIILTLPANVSTGCLLALQVSVNGELSNSTTISIAAGSESACSAPGITADQLSRLDQGGKFTVGVLSIAGGIDINTSSSGISTAIRVDTASATFVALNSDQLTAGALGPSAPPVANNSCVVTRGIMSVPTSASAPAFNFALLDAGMPILNGPNVSNVPITALTILSSKVSGVAALDGSVLAAGTYTFTSSGGKDVGPFVASIKISQPLVVTGGLPSTVVRSQDLSIAWTGGGTDPVTISGSSSVRAPGSTATNVMVDSGVFRCVTTADKGAFTVPSSILQQLPASSAGSSGGLNVSSNSAIVTFTAPLAAGGNLDYGYFSTGYDNRSNPVFK